MNQVTVLSITQAEIAVSLQPIGLIKSRKAEPSARGVYVQDKELLQTDFIVGTNFKYEMDADQRKVTVLPTDEKTRHTVSKRKMTDGTLKPVIDIRGKAVLEILAGCTEYEVNIFVDRIEVIGKVEEVNKCTFCGREDTCGTKMVGGYTILEVCTDCEDEILTVD